MKSRATFHTMIALFICVVLQACDSNPLIMIQASKLFLGNGEILDNGALIFQGNRIVDIGKAADFKDRKVDKVFKFAIETTLMPGLINANVHLRERTFDLDAKSFLENGITTLRDLGTDAGTTEFLLHYPESLKGKQLPTILFCGPMFTTAIGYPVENYKSDTFVELDVQPYSTQELKAYKEQFGNDLTYMHIVIFTFLPGLNTLNKSQLSELQHFAKQNHIDVHVNVGDKKDIITALELGFKDFTTVPLNRISDGVLDEMIKAKASLIPSLSTRPFIVPEEERLKYIYDFVYNVKNFYDRGGLIGVGSDFHPELMSIEKAEPDLIREMIFMGDASIPRAQILKAATYNNAKILKLKTKGQLEVGFDADLVVFPGDIADDSVSIELMARPVLVVKHGNIVFNKLDL